LQFIPPDGITVFGNGLHTHLVGMYGGQFHFSVSVALHYRYVFAIVFRAWASVATLQTDR